MITVLSSAKQTTRYRIGILLFIVVAAVCTSWIFASGDVTGSARREIVLRKIGHEVLLHSGDSTSRVLPIQKISDELYQIRFEHAFTFKTDSLVAIVRQSLKEENLLHNYIVNVKSCDNREVLYGFAIAENVQKDIVPCKGRNQPKGCYLIELQLQGDAFVSVKKVPLIAGLSALAFVGLILASPFRIRKRQTSAVLEQSQPNEQSDVLLLGNTTYDPAKGQITIAGVVTELTPKENQLLKILAENNNGIIERSRLQKELWEDEGVIVGRSLDVFISKLRKKLENDKSLELKNIHGKGYRLEFIVMSENKISTKTF
ncbi:MAG: winged helix-turn-helix domain-containing protein [Bacteroidota bacterium]